MENSTDKPLYSLTVGEFTELTRQIVLETLKEQQAALAAAQPSAAEKDESNLTIKELTKFLRCSRMSIYNYKKLGLPFYRLGRKILFKKNEVLDFMRRKLGRDNPKNFAAR